MASAKPITLTPHFVTQEDKVLALRKEFLELDVNHLESVSKEELFDLIDRKTGTSFDREIAEQLSERMQKDYLGKMTIDSFIQVFLEAEEILQSKICNSREVLQELYRSRKEFSLKLEEQKQEEVINTYGVMVNAQLNVVVIAGINFSSVLKSADPFLVMYFDNDQKFETGIGKPSSEPQMHNFGHIQHKFNVKTGSEALRIEARDFNKYTQESFVGQISIPLSSLNDQNSITQEYQLYTNNGQISGSSIVLQLQYIYSRLKNQEIFDIENDLFEYYKDIETLYLPFKSLQRLYKTPVSPHIPTTQRERFEDLHIKAIPLGSDPNENVVHYTRVLSIFFLILILLLFFIRSPYLDLLAMLYYVHSFQSHSINDESLTIMVVGLSASCITEILWLLFFSEHWINPESNMIDRMEDIDFKKAEVIISFIAVVVRILLIACLWVSLQQLKNPKNKIVIETPKTAHSLPKQIDTFGSLEQVFDTKQTRQSYL